MPAASEDAERPFLALHVAGVPWCIADFVAMA